MSDESLCGHADYSLSISQANFNKTAPCNGRIRRSVLLSIAHETLFRRSLWERLMLRRLGAVSGHCRGDFASRTSFPSRTMPGQFGQTRTDSIPVGANTRTYCSVTNSPQFRQSGIVESVDPRHFILSTNSILEIWAVWSTFETPAESGWNDSLCNHLRGVRADGDRPTGRCTMSEPETQGD